MAFRKLLLKAVQSPYVVGAAASCLYVGHLYPHTWGLPGYHHVLARYKDGEETTLDPQIQKMGQELLGLLDWDLTSLSNIQFFSAYGQDTLHKGSTFTKPGAIIGVPNIFSYKGVDDVERDEMTLNNKPINWESDAGERLLQSLILSEKAQKFAMLREIQYCHTQYVHVGGLMMTLSAFMAYGVGFAFNKLWHIRRLLRVGVYSLAGVFGILFYITFQDKYNWYIDKKADRLAASVGKEFAEGGAEFYSQLLKRNVALRALLGDDGHKLYTAYGNLTLGFLRNQLPLTKRQENVQQILNTLQSTDVNKF